MNENIIKPITLVKDEFSKQLVDAINSSKLPMFVVEYVLKDILNEVHVVATKQAQTDMINYTAQLKEQEGQESQNNE